jgi:Fe-S-cluster containining protein
MLTDQAPHQAKRLNPGDPFRFACSSGLPCFNTCCRNKDLLLSPYDVLRLKTARRLHSDRFLREHVLFRPDPASGFPVLSLRMQDDRERHCPFVGEQGCTVYCDRPTACRLYPLGRATGYGAGEEFFFLLDTPVCLGVREEQTVTLEEWLQGQGLEPYLAFNNLMLKVLFHKKRDPRKKLSQEQVQKVIVACYNLDAFRDFLFRSKFLKQAGVTADKRRKLKNDEEALLRFGFEFLQKVLFS